MDTSWLFLEKPSRQGVPQESFQITVTRHQGAGELSSDLGFPGCLSLILGLMCCLIIIFFPCIQLSPPRNLARIRGIHRKALHRNSGEQAGRGEQECRRRRRTLVSGFPHRSDSGDVVSQGVKGTGSTDLGSAANWSCDLGRPVSLGWTVNSMWEHRILHVG